MSWYGRRRTTSCPSGIAKDMPGKDKTAPNTDLHTSLDRSEETPSKNNNGANNVRGKDFPKEDTEVENDICDVKDVYKPLILITSQVEIRSHASNLGISDVSSVQEGEHIEDKKKRHQVPIELANDLCFLSWSIDLPFRRQTIGEEV